MEADLCQFICTSEALGETLEICSSQSKEDQIRQNDVPRVCLHLVQTDRRIYGPVSGRELSLKIINNFSSIFLNLLQLLIILCTPSQVVFILC